MLWYDLRFKQKQNAALSLQNQKLLNTIAIKKSQHINSFSKAQRLVTKTKKKENHQKRLEFSNFEKRIFWTLQEKRKQMSLQLNSLESNEN